MYLTPATEQLAPDMPVCNLYQAIEMISPPLRMMGLDVGKKTIGLALGDAGHRIASPHRILMRRKFRPDMEALIAEIDELQVGALVVGWPLNMDGSQGPRCDSVRDFAHEFLRLRDLPLVFQDERLSTMAVERAMLAADMTRAKRADRRDALAASWILQSAYDQILHNRLDEPPDQGV